MNDNDYFYWLELIYFRGMKRFIFLLRYLRYRIKAKDAHSLHSPFVFDLYNDTISDTTPFYCYADIESLRAKLMLTDISIEVDDHGAGSSLNNGGQRKISAIAKNSLKPAKYSQLLFRLVHRFKPDSILELGTSFGITTLYMAAVDKKVKVTTVEGCTNIARVAQVNFDKMGIQNIRLVNDRFDIFLPKHLAEISKLDFVFFDGNHTKKATLNYFSQCLEKVHDDTIFVFDDINWSTGMREAWNEVKLNSRVMVTIDLFFMGIVFFNKTLSREDFLIRF